MLKKVIFLTLALVCVSPDASASLNRVGQYYFQADLGYGYQKTRRVAPGNLEFDKSAGTYILGASWGYYWTDLMRSDLQFYYDNGVAKKGGVKNEIKSIGGFANLYYDLKNISQFTPYFIGGVGWLKNKMETMDANTSDGKVNASNSKGDMAYKMGFGVSYEGTDMVDVNLSYNYIFKHHARLNFTNSLSRSGQTKFEGMHAIMLGVRFNY